MKNKSVLDDDDVLRCDVCKSERVYLNNNSMYCENCGNVTDLELLIDIEDE